MANSEKYSEMTLKELDSLQKFLSRESLDNPELLKIQAEIEKKVDNENKKKD